MSDDAGPISKEALTVRVPHIFSDQVHASRKGPLLDGAVEQLVTPFTDASGKGLAPQLRAVHLAANVSVLPSGGLSGFVAVAEGTAPLAPLLENDLLGTGLTWFQLKDVDEAAVVKDFSTRPAPGFDLAAAAPEGRVTVLKGTVFPDTVFHLAVEANDRTAVAALRQAVADRNAAGGPVVAVKDIRTDPAIKSLYTAVFRASRELRNTVATQFAAAHGLAIDAAVAAGDQDTHIIQYSAVHSERSGSANRANTDVFLVYDSVVDSSQAHSGVMVFKGPISGYTLCRGRRHTVQSRPSLSWDSSSRDGRFSMFPADTGQYLGRASGRIPDRHLGTNPAVKAAGLERIKWAGDVGSYNPAAERAYHSPTDAAYIRVQSDLGAPPGGECTFVTLDTVVTEISGINTKDQSLAELIEVLDRSDETALPVKTNGSVFLALLKNWPAVRGRTKSKTLAEVFANERDDHVIVADHVLRAIAAAVADGGQAGCE